jgi:7-cyano-7-deazaguanine synthase in queuosine biosynthesis
VAHGSPHQLYVRSSRGFLSVVGSYRQELKLGVDPFFDALMRLPNDRPLDLLNIASGIYAIDRVAKRRFVGDELGTREFSITFEVRDAAFWSQSKIKQSLEDVLTTLSGDAWRLQFAPATDTQLRDAHQQRLDLVCGAQVDRVALFSGGLDSLAGLAARLKERSTHYALVSVTHQSSMRRRTRRQIEQLYQHLGATPALHLSVAAHLIGGKALRLSMQERTQRTRAFLFTACGAIAAHALGLRVVELFENGVGSLNFPPMMGMIFGPLSTRGSHPEFLRQMSVICTEVVGEPISFELPFATQTKGEMVSKLRHHKLEKWLQSSRSCAHTLRIRGKTHCGVCPACIERRQAFAIAEIDEDPQVYVSDIFSESPQAGPSAAYLRMYVDEAANWRARRPSTAFRLVTHLEEFSNPGLLRTELIDLLDRHAMEIADIFGSATSGNLRLSSISDEAAADEKAAIA